MPIDLIVHTPGGLVLAAEQIAHAPQTPTRWRESAALLVLRPAGVIVVALSISALLCA
jgi:hypothetical protein